jgi:murein DD-endopeptidase MepM/ murein hydrolase activator NlpD
LLFRADASASENGGEAPVSDNAPTDDITPEESSEEVSSTGDDTAGMDTGGEEAQAVFSEDDSLDAEKNQDAAAPNDEDILSNALIAAFLESQEEYSDYAIPAGVTYEMPAIGISYQKPLEGEVTSPFGFRIHPTDKTVKFHYGTDIGAKKGTPVTAFADGKVLTSGESATLGKYVVLNHGHVETQYAHCDSISVADGQTVNKGDKIATVGDTGNATDACLHFELKINGQYVNPQYYVLW